MFPRDHLAAEDVRAWMTHDVLLETHRYAPGPASATEKHAHDTYQLCLSLDFPGEYRYRGATLPVPVGSLSIIHPGEVHAARDPIPRASHSTFYMFYLAPELVTQPLIELGGRVASEPFFRKPIIVDPDVVATWYRVHRALEHDAGLASHAVLTHALTQLVAYHTAEPLELHQPVRATSELARVRDYIHAHAAARVSLDELAAIAGMSRYQFCRSFGQTYGISPHRYQLLVRIDRAKHLLARGYAPAQVAIDTGFSDQSHLGRLFKQIVGLTPATYTGQHTRHNARIF